MKRKIPGYLSYVLLLGLCGLIWGCAPQQPKKLLSEDIDVLTVFADDIAILKNAKYPTNSQEKYLAAKHLAESVDFALTRNVATLAKLFRPEDGVVTYTTEYGDEVVFYYNYQDHYVRLRFWFAKKLVTDSEVRIK
ncbi:hypothetical protein SDC9_80198 [bioreactor metagenome]|uniref:Uncharacterized protein n=1 Tax=bioreactor metagenome TaxID=1076179 RepID=A0A644Z0T5_9ZZZZ